MAESNQFPMCTICGMKLSAPSHGERFHESRPSSWNPELWQGNAIVLSGNRWSDQKEGLELVRVSDEVVSRHVAAASWFPPRMQIAPNGEIVCTQDAGFPGQHNSHDPSPDGYYWYLGIHAACEEIAHRVMQISLNAQIRSVGDLWVTLDRRCAKSSRDGVRPNFLPKIPDNSPGKRVELGLGRYYIPEEFIGRRDTEWDGWWEDDPLHIPKLTSHLMSNLEQIKPANIGCHKLGRHFATLPQEIKDMIISFLIQEDLALECTYLIPQSFWMQTFLQVPFLWDIDREIIHQKLLSIDPEENEWNWEKITRQVMTRPTPATRNMEEKKSVQWDYSQSGLVVPRALNNRRRIWQILEEMYPDDVGTQCA